LFEVPLIQRAPSDPLLKHVMQVPGGWLNNYHHVPRLWAFPVITLLGTAVTWLMLRLDRPGIGFIGSALSQAATILTAGCALFPFLMPSSTNPDQGLTIWDASST
jgi:cytochrome d ubiquinol oxidase subunit II